MTSNEETPTMITAPSEHAPWCRTAAPKCCGEPMVHNSYTEQYECSDAYFTLSDEGWAEGVLALVTAENVGPTLADTLGHWRSSRIPDRFIHVAVGAA